MGVYIHKKQKILSTLISYYNCIIIKKKPRTSLNYRVSLVLADMIKSRGLDKTNSGGTEKFEAPSAGQLSS